MHHDLKKVHAILVFGSHDTRAVKRAVELYKEGWALFIVFSGGFGTRSSVRYFDRLEAEVFADVAMEGGGIPAEHLLKEVFASNGELNVRLCRKLFEEKGLPVNKFIVV